MTASTIFSHIVKAKSSDLVAYVHHRLHPRKLERHENAFQVSENTMNRVEDFMHRHRLWVYCRKVMVLKKENGIEHSYLESREEIIQKLVNYKRAYRDDLEAYSRQMRHIEKVIEKCKERKVYFSKELQHYKNQEMEKSEESVKRLESRLKEFDEEIQFRQHVLEVQKELAANRFSEITQYEKELCCLEKDREAMLEQSLKEASLLDVPESIALTLFHYILNDGYFTYIPEEEWHNMMAMVCSKDQTRLKDHFTYDAQKTAYVLKEEQSYLSPIQRTYLLGDKNSSGISFMDFGVKRLLSEQLKDLSFHSYLNEVKAFYTYLVNEALDDGVLTREEMHMLDEIAVVLKIKVKSARDILNREAVKIQKNVINEQMMVFYDLAMADGTMQRDEAKFLVEINRKFERQIINKIEEVMASRQGNLRLHLNSEDVFVDMCKMVMKDGVLDAKECEMLMDYIQNQGWDKSKLQPILLKAVNGLN